MRWLEFKWIPLEQLRVSDANIRKEGVEREKQELKACIKKKQVLDVLTVLYHEDDQMYDIIKGQRRFLAAVELKNEGVQIPKLPCIVKEMTTPEAIEESLLDEIMRTPVEPNDTGKAILQLIEHYGNLEKVASDLGVSANWLDYYIQHLNLNPPAAVIETEVKEQKSLTLPELNKDQEDIKEGKKTEIESSPLNGLSIEERKEAQRLMQQNPTVSPILLKSQVKDWMEHSYELIFRMEDSVYRALGDWTKESHPKKTITMTFEMPEVSGNISMRRALDILMNKLTKEYLKEEKYL